MNRARAVLAVGASCDVRGKKLIRADLLALSLAVACILLGACGGSTVQQLSLSPQGENGRQAALAAGCAACHGSSGEGVDGLGPRFQSLFGSEMLLTDGSVLSADREYLRRATVESGARMLDGYAVPMPQYDLPLDDLEAILDFIEELE